MTLYAELTAYLGYREMQARPRLPFLFHGCTDDAPAGILAGGLRFREGEPCLTYNPATALLKYANPVRCSRSFHSGRADLLVRGFRNTEEAAAHYDQDPASGAVLIIPSGNVQPHAAASGAITVREDAVSGGLTKWLYCHVSPAAGIGRIPPESMAGMLRPSAALSEIMQDAALSIRQPGRPSIGAQELGEKLLSIPGIGEEETAFGIGQASGRLPAEEIAFGIGRCMVTAGWLDYLRQLAISCIARGRRLLKTDYDWEEEVFPVPFAEDLPEQAEAAGEKRCRDPWLEEVRLTALDMIRGLL